MSKSHPRWRLAKKILTWLFFIAVAVLLVVYAQKVDWEEVWKVIRNYNRMVLLGAVGLVIVSYLMYGCMTCWAVLTAATSWPNVRLCWCRLSATPST